MTVIERLSQELHGRIDIFEIQIWERLCDPDLPNILCLNYDVAKLRSDVFHYLRSTLL